MKKEDLRKEFQDSLSEEDKNFLVPEDYVLWLENKVIEYSIPPIVIWLDKMFKYAAMRNWYETYFFVDLHQTAIKPNYIKHSTEMEFYPYAKETLQLLTKRDDIFLILYTSSYPDEIEKFIKEFEKLEIYFNYINKNPHISEKVGAFGYYEDKPYFNALFEDKAGFRGDYDWKFIYEYFLKTEYRPNKEWKK